MTVSFLHCFNPSIHNHEMAAHFQSRKPLSQAQFWEEFITHHLSGFGVITHLIMRHLCQKSQVDKEGEKGYG